MSDFEREIVNCLNRFFTSHHIQGFAYRLKPSRLMDRHAGILVDCPHPGYNLAIECKSIIDKKLYFSQHFHSGKKNIHQIDAISGFLETTGRTGYLAVEFRQGPGKSGEAFLIPWATVIAHFKENKGISIDDARKGITLIRSKDGYVLEGL